MENTLDQKLEEAAKKYASVSKILEMIPVAERCFKAGAIWKEKEMKERIENFLKTLLKVEAAKRDDLENQFAANKDRYLEIEKFLSDLKSL